MNAKRTLPPLLLKNSSIASGIFSPPEYHKQLQQPSFFNGINHMNKLDSIVGQPRNNTKSRERQITSSLSPLLVMPTISSKKIFTGT